MVLSILLSFIIGVTSVSSIIVPDLGPVVPAGNVCETVSVEVFVNHYPIYISQYFHTTTLLNIPGGIEIDISIAPTLLITNTIAVQTVSTTVTSTVTTTAALPTSSGNLVTSLPGTFLIAVSRTAGSKARRQSASASPRFLDDEGGVATTCIPNIFFSLTNGQLSFDQNVFSTDGTVDSAPFAASSKTGSISTTFLVSGNTILWNNTAFDGSLARFCETASGITAVYRGPLPPNCFAISLVLTPTSYCVSITSSSLSFNSSSTISTTASTVFTSSSTTAGTTFTTTSATTSATTSDTTSDTVSPPKLTVNTDPVPIIPPLVGIYAYSGCYVDNNQYDLVTGPLHISSTMTPIECASDCFGYPYFGLVLGNDCFCSSTLGTSNIDVPTTSSNCNSVCAGNVLQYCGGAPSSAGGFLQLYHATDTDLLAQAESVILVNSYQTFCSTLLGTTSTIVTITQTNTETDTITTTIPSTVSLAAQSTSTETSTYIATTITSILARRAVFILTPNALTGFPASLITSACRFEATSVTGTSTGVTTASVTVTATSVSEPATTIFTTTVLNVATTVTTTSVTSNCPPTLINKGLVETLIFHGTGFREDTNNPGNGASPSIKTLAAVGDTTCSGVTDAVNQCASYLATLDLWESFDVHYLINEQVWECVCYFDEQTDPQYFNVADPNIGLVYGYSA